ncbi:MAG: SH3 domain-containing protein [Spirochaetales bacterium]|nr:SH3 domain-containing protein [Spirochaetales bacterium]
MFSKKILNATSIIIFVLLLFSCGSRYTGWAVLYMDDTEQNLKAGKVYPVIQESELRDVYTIETEESKTPVDVPRWNMSFFEKKEEAQTLASAYAKWVPYYAESTLNGLSIRQEPSAESDRVYKLRNGQTIKIIGRTDETENIAHHDGYWYQVLTEDGATGFCFDKNLNVYNKNKGIITDTNKIDTELLNKIISRTYRQDYFSQMIRANTIDLKEFKTTIGLFAFPEENKIVLTNLNFQEVFEYTGITQNNSGRFIFEGTSLQIDYRNENTIAIYYTHNHKEYAEIMSYIEDIDKIISDEIDRRQNIIGKIEKLGTISSNAYGKISFTGNSSFVWENYDRLIPNVIPATAGTKGKISLQHFPSSSLRTDYDGVLSFTFADNNEEVNFLFTLSELGIKLVFVPNSDIYKNLVSKENVSALVIFMSGAR